MTNPISRGFALDKIKNYSPEEMGGYHTLGNDVWSMRLKEQVKDSVHYRLAKRWATGEDPPIEDTKYYQFFRAQIDDGTQWGQMLEDESKIREQFNKYRSLFLDIRDNGYKPYGKVFTIYNYHLGQTYCYGDVNVSVDENGGFMLRDGMHRLAILLALDRPIEHVIISKREPRWKSMITVLERMKEEETLDQIHNHIDLMRYIRGCKEGQ